MLRVKNYKLINKNCPPKKENTILLVIVTNLTLYLPFQLESSSSLTWTVFSSRNLTHGVKFGYVPSYNSFHISSTCHCINHVYFKFPGS